MATVAELETRLLAELGKGKGADAAREVLLDAPWRSDSAQAHLTFALASIVASGARADLAWLGRLLAKVKKTWPDTWTRAWMLRSIEASSALLERLLSGTGKPVVAKALPEKAHPRWLARAGGHDFAELDALLADLTDGPATQIAERATALWAWPKDARIARAALAAHQGRLVSDPRHPIWNALAGLMAVHADAALRRQLADARVEDPRLAAPFWISMYKGGPDPVARKSTPRVTGGVPKTADDWVAWVMADPDDLKRRALWSDWLLEKGDPRGELLSLQLLDRALTPKEEKRVAALVKKHGKAWIGKLKGLADQLGFERGVLVECRIGAVAEGRVAADDPHWATLQRVTVPSYTMVPPLEAKLLSLAPRLTALDGPSLAFLLKVLAAGAAKLQQLSFQLGWDGDVAPLAKAKLPALRRLRVSGQPGNAAVKAIAAMPWFAQLDLFVVDGGDLGERLAAVQGTGLKRLDVLVPHNPGWEPSATGFAFRATRPGPKWKLEAIGLPERQQTVPPDYFYESHLLPALTKLKPGAFSEVTLVVPKGFEASPKMQRKIAGLTPRLLSG